MLVVKVKHMSNVVGITKPNTKLVTMLEGLVREAKAGTLTSIAAVVLRNDEADYAMEMSDLTTLETIGALEALKMELLNIT